MDDGEWSRTLVSGSRWAGSWCGGWVVFGVGGGERGGSNTNISVA